jgi:predicted ATPase
MLLVLDNREHLIDRCARLVELLLKGCAALHILATSREPLGIPGEVAFPVPPLDIPSQDQSPVARDIQHFEAIHLFVDRATAARPGFTLDDANAPAVAGICGRLDGLPLAIELAAARARSMSLADISQRLDHRFSLLSRGARTAAPRHQTLRATIDWSYELLAEDERILFRRLAVFAGGWTLTDAEAVCSDDRLPPETIADVHARVADKSLVVTEPSAEGASRFRLLETIREYATERLIAAGEVDAIRWRHFGHFLDLAERYYDQRIRGGSDSALLVLAAHSDNFRSALAWGAAIDAERALRLASALDEFWRMVNATEGWGWLQRLLKAVPDESPHRQRALLSAGPLAAQIAAYDEGTDLLGRALGMARQAGNRTAEAWASLWLGRLAVLREDVTLAEEQLQAALALHEEVDSPLGRVRSLALLGVLEAVILQRRAEGEEKLRTAADLAHRIVDGWGEGFAHMMLSLSTADGGEVELTLLHGRAALDEPSLGPLRGVPLQQLGRVSVENDPVRALRILGSAAGYLERTSTIFPGFVQRRADAARRRPHSYSGTRPRRGRSKPRAG